MFYLIESWQTYANATDLLRRWPFTQGNGGQLTQGGCLLDGSGGAASYCNTHFPPLTTLMTGFELTVNAYAPSVTNSSMLHTMQGGETNGNNNIGFGVNPTGTLSVFLGSNFSGLGGTTLANGTTVLKLGAKNWIECKIVYHPSAGSVEVRINGVQEILLTGINTNSVGGRVERLSLVAGANSLHLFGSLYIGDGAEGWQGPSTVKRLALTADTAQKNFTPSSGGSNFSLLNDLNNYTSLVSSGNIGDEDLYSIARIPYTPGAIRAVQVRAQAQNTVSSNLIKALVPMMAMGGSTRAAGARLLGAALPSAWQSAPNGVFTVAPDGSAWTPNKLQACSVGMRVASWRAGINFRSTAAFVADTAQNTYCINDVYPVTRGGLTFGWNTAGTGTVKVDRNAGVGDFYAGINCQQNNATQRTFKVDLPAAGRYAIKALFGDVGFAHDTYYAQLLDGAAVLGTIDTRTLSSAAFAAASGRAIDASGRCQYLETDYAEYSDWIEVSMTGTQLGVKIGTPIAVGTHFTCITHLEVIALDYAPAPSALAPTVQVASLFVEALISNDLPIMLAVT